MTDPRPPLLLYSQGSVGLGHLSRSLALADGLAHAFRVVLLYGGRIPPDVAVARGVDLVPLPALNATSDDGIVGADGDVRTVVDAERRRVILATLALVRPRVVVTELFPFGRKKFTGEALALLAAARTSGGAAPLVVSSVRDVLVRGRRDQQRFDDRAAATANRWFDHVLVHADPNVADFSASFRPSEPLRPPLHYTGFVHAGPPAATSVRRPGILVTAGGGAVGGALLRAAAAARRLLPDDPLMTIVAGPFASEPEWRELQREAAGQPRLRLIRSTPEVPALLHAADASVSQCGYNTALDLLAARVPSLVVPFATDREDEQTRRANRLAALDAVRVLAGAPLTPARLARELEALRDFRPAPVAVDLAGATRSAEILERLVPRRTELLAS